MKRLLLLFLTLLTLWGCGNPEEPTQSGEHIPMVTEMPTEPAGYYDPTHELEELTGGALKVFPMEHSEILTAIPMGDDLLVFTHDNSTTLMTLLRGDQLYESASTQLPSGVSPFSPSFHVSGKGIVYYDQDTGDLVYLDPQFREINRLPLPEDLRGEPILSTDRKSLYYLTEDSLREMDLDLGIDRLIRQMPSDEHYIADLHCDDTILECYYRGEDHILRHLFYQLSTGELIAEIAGNFELTTGSGLFFAEHQDGAYPEKLIGAEDGEIRMLHMPDYTAETHPVLDQSAVVTVTQKTDAVILDYYRMEDGIRLYSLALPGNYHPISTAVHASGEALWLTVRDSSNCDFLCCWDLAESAVEDDTVYIGPRRTADNPDTFRLSECAELAAQISEKHGVEILIWTDATAVQPRDHTLTPEHQPDIIWQYLTELDQALACYPSEMLSQAVSEMGDGKLRIGLARAITGTNIPDSPSGLQFLDEETGNAYVILQVADNLENQLHHELFHVMESRIFSLSKALDDWEDLNPKDFQYDYSYLYYAAREDRSLIEGENRAFVDLYSMTFPMEDRARIMEYAMMADMEDCFASHIMQAKLRAICTGIRKAYGLTDTAQSLPWEQYLAEPIRKLK